MEDSNRPIMKVNFEADINDRKGRFANFFSISTKERVAILDCFLVDTVFEMEDGSEEQHGILETRVLMDIDSLIQLRNMLDRHISEHRLDDDDSI